MRRSWFATATIMTASRIVVGSEFAASVGSTLYAGLDTSHALMFDPATERPIRAGKREVA